MFQPTVDEPLGSMRSFQLWSKGSTGAKVTPQQIPNTSNIYAVLDNNSIDDKRMGE